MEKFIGLIGVNMGGVIHNGIIILNYKVGIVPRVDLPPRAKTTMPDQAIKGVGDHVLCQIHILYFEAHILAKSSVMAKAGYTKL